jgi:hypothetical protein
LQSTSKVCNLLRLTQAVRMQTAGQPQVPSM